MHHPTSSSRRAQPRRRHQLRAAAMVATVAALVAVLGIAPEVVSGQPSVVVEDLGIHEADARSALGSPTIVADPGPADVLNEGHAAPQSARVIRDLAYGPDDAHRLDLHLPAAEHAPVIVFLHSGGWYEGSRADLPDWVLRFLDRGYAVASIDYRLAPEHPFPAPVHDVKRAIRELKAIGAATGLVDGDALVLLGISAGGHLAAFIAATVGEFEPEGLTESQSAHDSSVAGIVVAAGPTDLVAFHDHHDWAAAMTAAHVGCDACADADLRVASPVDHVHPGVPPAYWAYGELDPLVDAELQGRRAADAWARAAGPGSSWFDLVEGERHVLDGTMINQTALERFLDATLAH